MADEVLYDLGVDINSDYTFVDGDIALSSYNDNLVQAVVNRLRTDLGELDLFYEEYGSVLQSFFGWRANDETIGFMRAEINKVLSEEVRLDGHTCDITYDGYGRMRIELTLYPIGEVSIDVNLVLSTTGVIELETDELTILEED